VSKRLWINIIIGLVFLSMIASGVLLFILPYNALFSGLHIWFGICFIIIGILHISINFRALLRYIKNKISLIITLTTGAMLCIILLSVNYRIQPFSTVLDFSSKLKKTAVVEETHIQTILINREATGQKLTIEAKVGEQYRGHSSMFYFGKKISSPPQFVFWLENIDGKYLETIFITAKTGFPILHPKDTLRSNTVYRQEALPYWLHKRNKEKGQNESISNIDGISGATPHAHFNIKANTPSQRNKFRILAEINRSFDFNDFYTEDRYPNDPIYIGDGYPGQPSIIYAVNIDLSKDDTTYIMKPIGHGHYSGTDGNLYTDMTGIDSALKIFQRILVELH